jgi:hypothetical protein
MKLHPKAYVCKCLYVKAIYLEVSKYACTYMRLLCSLCFVCKVFSCAIDFFLVYKGYHMCSQKRVPCAQCVGIQKEKNFEEK